MPDMGGRSQEVPQEKPKYNEGQKGAPRQKREWRNIEDYTFKISDT